MLHPSKPGFNPLVARISPPPIPAVQAWARKYDGSRGPLIDLSQAVPGYPPHADLLEWLGEAAGSVACTGYGAIEGDLGLRLAYSAHVAELYGASVGADDIQITAGCNQAFVAAIMAVAGPGDAVLMTNPRYFNHETTLAMLGVSARYVECRAENGFLPEPSEIAAKLDGGVKAVALVSPNNPTGAVYPPALLREIFELCRARRVWLMLDETYRDFLPADAGRPHDLLDGESWRGNLIQLYSFSKSFCIPGHRLGAVAADASVINQIAKVMDNLQICAPRAPQAAVSRGLPALGEWREGNRREIEARSAAMRAALERAPGWELQAIGAYFAFVRHPFASVSSVEVAERLAVEAGVATIPGEFFGSGLERHLRVAFANADVKTIAGLPGRLTALGVS
ncbi:aminotransferase [Aquamicrobium sp. LC103]|nr:aminotransferase [Aquamicrobium sp. LC103]